MGCHFFLQGLLLIRVSCIGRFFTSEPPKNPGEILLLLLLLSCFSRVQFCATPWMAAPGSPVPGILQARTLEWVAISFSNAWKWKVKVKLLSHVQPLVTPWTAAYQAPPSMGFFQARILEWGVISFFRGSSWSVSPALAYSLPWAAREPRGNSRQDLKIRVCSVSPCFCRAHQTSTHQTFAFLPPYELLFFPLEFQTTAPSIFFVLFCF